MKNLTRRIAASIRKFLRGHHQRLKKKAFASDFCHTFRQLECRRVLSVTGVFDNVTGSLAVTIASGGNTNGALLVDGADFYVDENGNLARDPGDESGLLADLKQIQVNSAPGVGTFAWRGDFSTSNLLQSLLVQNVSSTSIGATASLLGNLSVSSATSIVFESTAAINAGGTADLSGGSIQFSAGSSLDATSNITLQASGLDSDIQIDGSIQTTNGSINLTAPDSILFGPTGSLDAGNNGNITLTANSDSLNGNGIDGIQMGDGSSIQVANGTIRLSALNSFAGDITLGELIADTNAGTAIEVQAGGNILDGTALDSNLAADANLQANFGTILLQSAAGSIGAGVAASDIDINSQGLVFNSPGIVQITDVTGGVQVNGASSALGGGFLAANSPLTISANVNVGASMAFTAGDSALPGDDLTIDSGAIVTLTSAAAGVLTFNAGDSIRFNSGRIVTTGGGLHSVQLSADLDNAGVGAADGDRGVIQGDGTAIVEVSTDNLTANAANGIDIDTTVATLTASNTVTGGIVVRETDGIVLTSVTSTSGSVDVTAAGLITATSVVTNVAGDVTLVSTNGDVGVGLVQANAGNVTITAQNNIIDTDPLPDSLVFDIVGNDITLTANTGNIGSTSSDIFRERVNPLEISASGNYTATALLGMIAINLDATNALAIATTTNTLWYQSNGDINVAGLTLANNLALIADADNNGVGTLFLGNSLAVPGDLRVEGADISAADGSIDLSANRMMVYSGQTEILFVDTNQFDATTNGDLSVFANNSIELIDLAAPFQVDHNPVIPPIDRDNVALQTLGNGFLFVQANGSITVSDDVIAGNDAIQTSAGSIRLQALAANGNVIVNDTILSDLGAIFIEANQDILIDGAISATEALDTDNLALVTSTTGNITLRADLDASSNGAITMADGTRVIAGRNTLALYDPGLNGNPSPTAFSLGAGAQLAGSAEISLFAFGSVTLGSLQSENIGTASISVRSTNGSITDNTAAETSNLITAGTATLSAAQGIGAAGAADIDTTIDTLIATNTTSGGIFVQETNGLFISGTGVRTLAGGGNINIDVDAGNLTVNSVVSANGVGTITLNADAGTLAMSAAVSSTSGSISITGDAVNQNAGGNIATGGAGIISVTADNGSIVMADGTTTTTANGVINYSARVDVAISRLSSTDATINVTADSDLNLTGAITDSLAAETPNLITTGTAVLVAAQGIGAAGVADIDTTIGTLVATNSTIGNIFVQETDGLIIAGTGVRTLGGSGNINVDVDAGNLTVNSVVTANGSGTVTLNADGGTIDLNAAVSSGSGAIAITGDIVNQNGNISTGGGGTATVRADNGSITMTDGTTTNTTNGAINYTATGNVLLSQLISTNASIDGTADSDGNGTGSITDNTVAEASNLITAGTATLSAAQGIGAAGDADIDTTIGTLVATNTTSGDIFVQETNGLTIGGTGVRTLAGDGNINIDVEAGDLTVSSVVTANGAGTITLNADAGTVAMSAAVSSTSGAISITGDAVNQNAGGNIATGGAGAITVTADNGSIVMANGTTTTTANGVINYSARVDVAISRLSSTDATISVTADSDLNDTGAITDSSLAETPNLITTGTAVLVAAQGIGAAGVADIDTTIGTLVATNRTIGSIFVQETDGLFIAATGVQTLAGGGNINIDVDAGSLTVNSVVTANGLGTVTLNADAGTIDLNAAVSSGSGAIAITGDIVNQNAGGNISTGGTGTATVTADNGNITMVDGTTTTTTNGAINYTATGNVLLSQLISTDASINVTADSDVTLTGSITDNTVAEASNLITAGTATLSAAQGIGAAGAADIDTSIGTLVATNSTSGDIFVQETNGLTIGGTGVRTIGGNGNIVIDVLAGNLTVNSLVAANGAGNVLLQTQAADGDIIANAVVLSGSGNVSLLAGDDVVLNSNVSAGGTGTVYLLAANATADLTSGVDMASGASVTTTGGNVRVLAQNNGDIRLARIDVASGNVSLIASRSILDANGATLNVSANQLRMVATNGTIGGPDLLNGTPDINVNAIDTQVSILAATSAIGIYIREADGLTVDNTVAIDVQQVNVDASTTAVSDSTLEDLSTSIDGPIKLQSLTGNIVINSGTLVPSGIQANGTGDVLLQTLAANGDIVVNGVVRSGTGHISLVSGDDVRVNANILTSGAGSIFLVGNNGTADGPTSFDMLTGTNLTTAGGNVRVVTGNNGDVRLGFINVGAGNVSLIASGSILDANGASVNVIANALRMVATNGSIGEADPLNGTPDVNVRAIDTQVLILAASSATGIHVLESDGVTIDNTGAISVQKVNFNSTETAVVDANAEDLTTSNNGSIKLLSLAGDIVVNAGTAASQGIQANGTGDILLQTQAANGDILVNINGGVRSQAGHITMKSGDDVKLVANVATGGSGTVYLLASNATADAINGVDMDAVASVATAGGNVRIEAQNGDVKLGLVDAGNGSVSINAKGSVVDANGDSLNIAARNLRIQAETGALGDATNAIETRVSVIAAKTDTGIFVFDSDGVRVDDTGAISVQQINFNSTQQPVIDASLEDLQTSNGSIQLRSATGDIVINSGTDGTFGVNAVGAGNDVILQVEANAGPQSGNIILNTLVRAADDISLISKGGSIDEGSTAASVQGDLLTIDAALYAHLHNTQVNQLAASTGRNQTLDAGVGQIVNANASNAGDDFLSNLSTGIATPVSLTGGSNPSNFQFADKYSAAGYSLYIVNGRSLQVNNLSAGTTSLNVSPNIYIETQGASNLIVSGAVVTQSSTSDEGGIVLVAGAQFTLNPTGRLETHTVVPAATQFVRQIGPIAGSLTPASYLDAQFFERGQGSDPDMRSTLLVLPQSKSITETPLRHVNQRVAVQFGFPGESGFVTLIGYADGGQPRVFDTFGEQGKLPLNSGNPAAINSFPNSAANNAIFTRPEPFDDAFLNTNNILFTNVVVRRSSDFFVFENASEVGGTPVKDLTFEYKQIQAIAEGGGNALDLPAGPPPLPIPIPGTFVLPALVQNPISIRPPEIEFADFLDKPVQVFVYPITYNDLNRDGQPDLNELPLEKEVLESVRKLKPIDEILSPDGGAPTPQLIDAKKADLLRDPQLPSGAYAIVEKDADGKEVVIDVFPIRDWESETSDTSKEMPLIPNKDEGGEKKDEPSDDLIVPRPISKDSEAMVIPAIELKSDGSQSSENALLEPSANKSRFASVGMMFGSLWVLREATKSETKPTDQAIQELGTVGFSRSERRKRRTTGQSFSQT